MPGTFWNDAIETLSPEEVRRLETERLTEQIAYNHASSAFYRAKLDAAGVRPDEIRDRADLARIPFMEKGEIADSQADGTLLGITQCAPLDRIVRIQATGGTTGQPIRIGLTRRDIADYGEVGAQALWAMGCRPGDIVFECMNYNLYSGGLSDHLTFETLGAATIPFGVGHTERLLAMMAALQDPVGIWATPSYAIRLAEVARDLGIEPRSVGLRKGYFSGEAGLQVPGYREKIEDIWGMVARDQYGTGELGLHSGECEHQNGVHFGATGIAIAELIDPDSGEVLPFEDGQQGEVVYTSIHREASPLMRMRSHALAGGFELALMCDVRFAAKGAQFGLPDTPLGLSPTSGMTYLLPRIVGLGRAMYLTLWGENIDAEEAERIGLVSRVIEPDTLLEEAQAFAHRVAAFPRVGVTWTKHGFHRALDSDFASATRSEEEAELACFRSPDTRERLSEFVDRKRR